MIRLQAIRATLEEGIIHGLLELTLSEEHLPVISYTDRLTKLWNSVLHLYIVSQERRELMLQGNNGEIACIQVLIPDDFQFLLDTCNVCYEICNLTDELRRITSHLFPVEHAAVVSPTSSQVSILSEAEEIARVARTKLESVPMQFEMKCVYCSVSHSCTPQQVHFYFKRHPYVSHDFAGKPLHLCHKCYRNWEIYRKDAADHGELLLEGETNEEACAVCSDIVDEIILCDQCQRSYCNPCLIRILSAEDMEKMRHSDIWRCMMCDAAANASAASALVEGTPRETPRKGKSKCSKSNGGGKGSKSSKSSVATPVSNGKGKRKKAESSILNAHIPNISRSPGTDDAPATKQPQVRSKARAKREEKVKADLMPLPEKELKKLPPVNKRLDEFYYFSQYVKELLRAQQRTTTDDFCFLCKDGGELVECDFVSKSGVRCQKVYHEYCLGFKVLCDPWCCARHRCCMCRKSDIKYQCKYCALALCNRCRLDWAEKQQNDSYLIPDVKEPVEGHVESIVCCNCIRMIDTCIERSMLFEYHRHGVMAKFPPKRNRKQSPTLLEANSPQQTGVKRSCDENLFTVSPSISNPTVTTRARRKTFEHIVNGEENILGEEERVPEMCCGNGEVTSVMHDNSSLSYIDLTESSPGINIDMSNEAITTSDALSAEMEMKVQYTKPWSAAEEEIISRHLKTSNHIRDMELANYILTDAEAAGIFACRSQAATALKIRRMRTKGV